VVVRTGPVEADETGSGAAGSRGVRVTVMLAISGLSGTRGVAAGRGALRAALGAAFAARRAGAAFMVLADLRAFTDRVALVDFADFADFADLADLADRARFACGLALARLLALPRADPPDLLRRALLRFLAAMSGVPRSK
jgi:hypothetical protein